jgi:hypothetical protein
VPSGLVTKTVWEAHGPLDGSMIPSFNNLSISVLTASLFAIVIAWVAF